MSHQMLSNLIAACKAPAMGVEFDFNLNEIDDLLEVEIGDIELLLAVDNPVCAFTGQRDCPICLGHTCEHHAGKCDCDMVSKHSKTLEQIVQG
jgi:hypothetical protein